jgi:amino acid transporter
MQKFGFFISVSAVVAATSVLLIFQIGQPRIWMAMSRDGLLPKSFGKVNKKYQTPGFSTVVAGLLVAGLVLVIDDKLMTDLTSIGTLFAFVLVSGGVLLLPRIEKQKGKFSIPYINAQYIFPLIYVLTFYLFQERTIQAVVQIGTEGYQEVLFIIFMVLAGMLAVLSSSSFGSGMLHVPDGRDSCQKLAGIFWLDGVGPVYLSALWQEQQ